MRVEWKHFHFIRMKWKLISTSFRMNEKKSRHHFIFSNRFDRKFEISTLWHNQNLIKIPPYKFVWGILHVWSKFNYMHIDAYVLMRLGWINEKIWSFESGWSAHEFDVLIMLFDQILLVVTSTVVVFFVREIFDVLSKFRIKMVLKF